MFLTCPFNSKLAKFDLQFYRIVADHVYIALYTYYIYIYIADQVSIRNIVIFYLCGF